MIVGLSHQHTFFSSFFTAWCAQQHPDISVQVASSATTQGLLELVHQVDLIIIDLAQLAQQHIAIQTIQTLSESLRQHNDGNPRRILCLSSMQSWTGNQSQHKELLEQDFANRSFEKTLAGRELYTAEQSFILFLSKFGAITNTTGAIITPGLLYGAQQDVLASLFWDAFLAETKIRVPAKINAEDGSVSTSSLSTIHVADLSALILSIAQAPLETLLKHPFILAVDSASPFSLAKLAESVSQHYTSSSSQVECYPIPSPLQLFRHPQASQIRALTSPLVFSPQNSWIHSNAPDVPSFSWHSREGPIAHVAVLAQEFAAAHRLQPVRVLVSGGPLVGKSTLAQELSDKFKLPVFSVPKLLKEALDMKDEFAVELEKSMVPNSDKKNKKKNDKRLPLDRVAMMLLRRVNNAYCRSRGFILDGIPRSLEEANVIFSAAISYTEPSTGITLSAADVAPTHLVFLSATSDSAAQRQKSQTPDRVVQFHTDDEGFKRRWEKFVSGLDATGDQSTIHMFAEDPSKACLIETNGLSAADVFNEVWNALAGTIPRPPSVTVPVAYSPQQLSEACNKVFESYQASQKSSSPETPVETVVSSDQTSDESSSSAVFSSPAFDALLENRSEETREYLAQSVATPVVRALIALRAQDEVEDPVEFVAQYLLDYHQQLQAYAAEAAAEQAQLEAAATLDETHSVSESTVEHADDAEVEFEQEQEPESEAEVEVDQK